MTVKSCEKLEKSRVALTIETSAEEFEAAVNKAYLKMRGKINVPQSLLEDIFWNNWRRIL